MRVITGKAKGRRLETLSGDDVRPTTDRVKEAVFSIVQFQIQGRKFLDLFAGSGQMGIESLSRGADSATFVDKGRQAAAVIKQNLKTTGFESSSKVVCTDSISFLQTETQKYDIAFVDPPYNAGLLEQAMELLPRVMQKSGVILCETALEKQLPEEFGEFVLDRNYRYGKIKICMYIHKDMQQNS